ncbi:hypothetical protein [Pseudopedobacter beijingensis]|uniref:Uncharacterized protein n=1 Tax=Pseudopedobacter beijingensis TaxID=1207056 RepID=A0ABW4IE14_9SPHI
MLNETHILLFKTSVTNLTERERIQASLDKHPHIISWTVDLSDEDFVLRVVATESNHQFIISMVEDCGFHCQILN